MNERLDNASSIRLARDLLSIARLAMPDTYYATDSRCRRARRVLDHFGALPKRERRFLEKVRTR